MSNQNSRIGLLMTFATLIVLTMFGGAFYFDKPQGEGYADRPYAETPPADLVDAPAPATVPEPAYGYEDAGEKDSPESLCIQQGFEWDGLNCYQPQLPDETKGRADEPVPSSPAVTAPAPPANEPENDTCG